MEEIGVKKQPENELTTNETTLSRTIKTEKEYHLENENSGENDEASMDNISDAYADQNDANDREEYFMSNSLVIPYVNKLWNESSTRLFLNMYKELKEKYETGESCLKHRQRFAVIATNLEKYGFDYTAVQVENRFKSLKRSYQKKAMQEEVLDKQGKIKPSHPSSQYHLYVDDMREIFGDCMSEMREAAANPSCSEIHTNEKGSTRKARKRKQMECPMEDLAQSEGDEYSESRSEEFRNSPPSFIQQLQNKIRESITRNAEDCRFTEVHESPPPFHFPNPNEHRVEDAVEELRLIRADYNTWQKIREDGKNRRHQEKMAMYSQLIQAITSRK